MEPLRRGTLAVVMLGALVRPDGPLLAQPAMLGMADRRNEYVSIASDGQFVAIAWAASRPNAGSDVVMATSRDGGQRFSAPVRVNTVEGQSNVNGEQPPQVAIVMNAKGGRSIIVMWTGKVGNGTRLLASRSSDDGRTFAPAVPVTGTDVAGNRGWESMAVDSKGNAFALWLDHRDMASSGRSGEAHQHGPQASQLFVAALDGSAPQSLTRGVCYCCRTALVASEGAVFAAWRHVYPGNHRDIAFTMSRDGGRTFGAPVRVSDDNWVIDGCPENGPAMAVDRQRRVHVVWPTRIVENGSETLALFQSSTADGRAFAPRTRIPTSGAAYHPRLVPLADGSLVAAWDEALGTGRRIKLARGTPDRGGAVTFRTVDAGAQADGRYPAIAVTPTHLVVAWTTRQADTSRIAIARIPLS